MIRSIGIAPTRMCQIVTCPGKEHDPSADAAAPGFFLAQMDGKAVHAVGVLEYQGAWDKIGVTVP